MKTASHKVKEGVNFVASTAKGFADKIGSLWNKGATTVKTSFLQGNEKIQHAVKTLLEYKWIPDEGKGFAMAGVGNASGGGQYSLKEAYQYMESKVVKGTGDVGDIASGANIKKLDDFSGPLENGPYIKNGKTRGRPQLSGEKKLGFEKDVFNKQIDPDGILRDH